MDKVGSFKFLGIYIDSKLRWPKQTDHIALTITKNIGIIRYVSYYLPQKTLASLC